jgi:hypothetical protein
VNRLYLLQFFCHIAGDVHFFVGRIFFCRCDCKSVPINPDHALKFVAQRFCKKSSAAISID